jgi:excisionase family DNA binding protein
MDEERLSTALEPLLLTAEEVAILLGIGRTKVFEMLASGELPAIRIGRCVRISRDQLDGWIYAKLEAAGLTRRLQAVQPGRPSGRS